MTLWLIRSEISTRDLMRWIGSRQMGDTDRAMHCLLGEIFGGEDAPQPYRAILPRRARGRHTLRLHHDAPCRTAR